MNVELLKLIGSMRENKGHLETLHLDGDVELTARRKTTNGGHQVDGEQLTYIQVGRQMEVEDP